MADLLGNKKGKAMRERFDRINEELSKLSIEIKTAGVLEKHAFMKLLTVKEKAQLEKLEDLAK